MTTDVTTIIAHHATAATQPPPLPSPAPSAELTLREYRRRAQDRLNVEGLPRGTWIAALSDGRVLTTDDQDTLIVAVMSPDHDCAHNMAPLFAEVERIIRDHLTAQHLAMCQYALIEERGQMPCTFTGVAYSRTEATP